MAKVTDTEFRIVLRFTGVSPLSVQEVRAFVLDLLATANEGTYDLLRIEPESYMKKGVSGAPDKNTTKRRMKKDGGSMADGTKE